MKFLSNSINLYQSIRFCPNMRWPYLNKAVLKGDFYFPIITVYNQYCSNVVISSRTLTTVKSSTSQEQTMDDVREKIRLKMGVPKGYVAIPPNRAHLLKFLSKSQEELSPRSLKDSFDSAIIPLRTNKLLQDKYMTWNGKVRKGRLLEDMDIFCVWICLKHILYPNRKPEDECIYTIVTASVDEIEFAEWLCNIDNDIKISGRVEWTGKTSLEVCVWIESKINDSWKLFTKAYFLMVARNSTLTGSVFVNSLKPEKEEIEIHQNALRRSKRRTQKKRSSLFQFPPTEEEQLYIHDLFMKTLNLKTPTVNSHVLPNNAVWMESTITSNTVYPHPEDRNFNNTIFGGYLMRLSSELSWVIAFNFFKSRPNLRHISDITFKSPVSTDSFLKLTGQVAYTHLHYAVILVHFELLNIVTNELVTTNTFNFIYKSKHILPEVVPKSYLEAVIWLEARRLFIANFESESASL